MFRLLPGFFVLSLVLVILFSLVSPVSSSDSPSPIHFDSEDVFIARQGASPIRVHLELAFTQEQQQRGLQYRTELPLNHGMLFVFDSPPAIRRMWMADTPRSLDMLFLDEHGVILRIVSNTVPFSHDIISSEVPAAAVVEVNAGFVKKHAITPGDKLLYSGFSH